MRTFTCPDMAVDVNNGKSASTIAFTLPISCQICLGKVKSPLLCPNNHVFCSQCLEIWLERNKQCPACRTPIDDKNPCREIRGGVSVAEEQETNNMNTSELRRARFEMLFKDYESELCLVEAKMEALKIENKALLQQLEITKSSKSSFNPVIKEVDMDALGAVTKKLQDVNHQCEKVKQEAQKYKKANGDLKEENDILLRENQRLRMEITSRSPHRYGRTTVAALQSQIDTYEKEVQQLNKALEKSDVYIEDLEMELSTVRGKDGDNYGKEQRTKVSLAKKSKLPTVSKPSHKKQLFKFEINESDPESFGIQMNSGNGDSISPQKVKNVNGILVTANKDLGDSPTKGGKKVTFSLPQEDTPQGSQASSFDLEYPSPFAKSPSSIEDKVTEKLSADPPRTTSTISQSANKTIPDSQTTYELYSSETLLLKQAGPTPSLLVENTNKNNKSGKTLDDTIDIETELDDLDISVTPEIKDCMKLFSMAERNVQQRSSLGRPSTNTDVSLEKTATTASRMCPSSTANDVYRNQDQSSNREDLTSSWKQGIGSSELKSERNPSKKSAASNVIDCSVPLVRLSNVTEINQTNDVSGHSRIPSSKAAYPLSGSYSNPSSHVSVQTLSKSKEDFAAPRGETSFTKNSSGSVVSSILGSNGQTAYKHSSLTTGPSTSFLSQSQSHHNHSSKVGSADSSRPGLHTTTLSSEFSQSLLHNSRNTESLANSLMKLEQTLAAHRASTTSITKPLNYQVPSVAKPITATSSVLVSVLPPPLPFQTGANLSSVPVYGSASYVNSLNALNPSNYNNSTSSRSSLPTYASANSTFYTSVHSQIPSYNNNLSTSNTVPALPSRIDYNRSIGSDKNGLYIPQSYPSAASLSSSILSGYSLPITQEKFPSNFTASASNTTSSVFSTVENNVLAPPVFPVSSSLDLEKPNNFSYVSNLSLNSNDLSSIDNSFLPEPKKRLFETDTDDTDMSFSPSKSSKLR